MWILLILLTFHALMPAQTPVSPPVQIESSAIVDVPSGSSVVFYLRNNALQPVVAWRVGVKITLTTGEVRSRELIVDGYSVHEGIAPAGPEESVIPPDGTVKGSIDFEQTKTTDVIAVRPSVVAAVFADRSAVGDMAAVKDIFQSRQLECDAYAFIVRALRAGHAQAKGRAALQASLEALNAPEQEDFNNLEKKSVRRELERLISRGDPPTGQPEDILRTLTLSMEARWQAANLHRQPKS
jgi:hypothetical protein